MKKWAWIAGIVVVLVVCGVFFGSGFVRKGDAYLEDYSVSEDGTEITLELGVASSAGYLRKAAVHQQAGGKLYLDCYAAFGGVNGSIGAQTTYRISLDAETKSIALYRNADCYEVILEKNEDGIWQRTGAVS